MAFIIALILFIVIIYILVSDKAGKARYKREYNEFQQNLKRSHTGFENYVASKEETDETRLNAFLEKVQYDDRNAANNETALARSLRKRIWEEIHIQPNPEMLTCALLAQEGKVPYEMKYNAYCTAFAEPAREYWAVENRFFKWLDKELSDHGMPFRLRFVTVDNKNSLGHEDEYKITESIQSENTLKMGTYYWTLEQGRYGKRAMIVTPYEYKSPYIEF